jgi:Icc-related predicted phosphoesterase
LTKTRIIFASDFHGNEIVWRKFLNSANMFRANILLMGGDMTAKVLVPIVEEGNGKYIAHMMGERKEVTSTELENFKKEVRKHTYMPYVCTPSEYDAISNSQDRVEEVFEKLEKEMVKTWCDLIPTKLSKDVKVIIHPGNDDKLGIDEVLKNHPDVIFAEESVVEFDDKHEAACVGWSNPTPWDSPRECSEEELYRKIESTIREVRYIKQASFCFHVPPFNSKIDEAPKLDEDLRPIYEGGRPVTIPVGSKSVRAAIEKYQPLLGLHGHIHESPGIIKIGRTQCINPGSEYGEGILKAYIIELENGKLARAQRLEG